MALFRAGVIQESSFVYPRSVTSSANYPNCSLPTLGFSQITNARTTGGDTAARATFYDVDGNSLEYWDIPTTGNNNYTIPDGAVYLTISRATAQLTLTP